LRRIKLFQSRKKEKKKEAKKKRKKMIMIMNMHMFMKKKETKLLESLAKKTPFSLALSLDWKKLKRLHSAILSVLLCHVIRYFPVARHEAGSRSAAASGVIAGVVMVRRVGKLRG
jgi:hypothetical protein